MKVWKRKKNRTAWHSHRAWCNSWPKRNSPKKTLGTGEQFFFLLLFFWGGGVFWSNNHHLIILFYPSDIPGSVLVVKNSCEPPRSSTCGGCLRFWWFIWNGFPSAACGMMIQNIHIYKPSDWSHLYMQAEQVEQLRWFPLGGSRPKRIHPVWAGRRYTLWPLCCVGNYFPQHPPLPDIDEIFAESLWWLGRRPLHRFCKEWEGGTVVRIWRPQGIPDCAFSSED